MYFATFDKSERVWVFATRSPFPNTAFDGSLRILSPSSTCFIKESISVARVLVPPASSCLSKSEGKRATEAAIASKSAILFI